MHTFLHDSIVFNFNSDFSGDVDVHDTDDDVVLSIPVAALIAFVAELVRREKIRELEDASDREVLGLRR